MGIFIFLLILVVIWWAFIQTLEEVWRLGSPNKYAINGFWRNLWEYQRKNFGILLFLLYRQYII
jgi:hypothetical protein